MLDRHCFTTVSTAWIMFGGVIMNVVLTRGIDSRDRPSFFFYHFGVARLILCALWTLLHLALTASQADVFFITHSESSSLLAANIIVDIVRIAALVARTAHHQSWCVGAGWNLLQSTAAPVALWPYFFGALLLSFVGQLANHAFTWRTASVSDSNWLLNVIRSFIFQLIFIIVLYLRRDVFKRGGIMTSFFTVSFICLLGAITPMLIQYYGFGIKAALSFNETYQYASISIAWGFISLVCLHHVFTWERVSDHVEMRPAAPLTPLAAVSDGSSSALGAESASHPASVVAADPPSADVWATAGVRTDSPDPGTDYPPPEAHSIAMASVVPVSAAVSLESASPFAGRASSSQLQLHRLAVGITEMLAYLGTIFVCECIISLSFPSLAPCPQTASSWPEFLLSVFDFLGS
jgi:hypothetical protein